MKSSFKSGADYPANNELKLSENEQDKFLLLSKNYQEMYVDAFVATAQCEALASIPDPKKNYGDEKLKIVKEDKF